MSREKNHFEDEYREPTARKIGEEPSPQEKAEEPAQPEAAETANAPEDAPVEEPQAKQEEPVAQEPQEEPAQEAEAPAEEPSGAQEPSGEQVQSEPDAEPSAQDDAAQTGAAMAAAAEGETAGGNKLRSEMKKERQPWSTKKKVILGVVIAAVAAACAFGWFFFFGSDQGLAGDNLEQIMDDGTFYAGVSIAGVDLSGKTADQARAEVEQAEDAFLKSIAFEYTVDKDAYQLGAQQLGAAVDIDAALVAAMRYGREGTFAERAAAINEAKTNGVQIDVPVTYDKNTILTSLQANDGQINVPAQDAAVEFKKSSDEGSMMTGSTITLIDEVVGKEVDDAELADKIYAQLEQNDFTPVTAETKVTQPKYTKAQLEEQYTMLGTYKTVYKSSAEGRRYNIWKMADIINGVKIMPGETWSINDEAGPRTYKLGWKGAPGISDGEYQTEAGGGICQVSSTLYNAVLRAEVKIEDRKHHSWPLDYVPGGLDATISTGAPDFKISNNYDIPIYIVATCDGQARTIEVSIYGPKFEDGLTRDFTSELVSNSASGGEKIIEDPSMPAGQRRVKQNAHNAKTYVVYKIWRDADGNEVKKEKYSTEVYSAFPAIVYVGTAPTAPPTTNPAPPTTDPAPNPDPAPPVTDPPAPNPDPAPDPNAPAA